MIESSVRRRGGGRGADHPAAPLRVLIAVNDPVVENRLARCADVAILAVVRDLAALELHVPCGGTGLVLHRRFTGDPVAVLQRLPAHWGALVLCGRPDPAALRLGSRVASRPCARHLYGSSPSEAALRRALVALAAQVAAFTAG